MMLARALALWAIFFAGPALSLDRGPPAQNLGPIKTPSVAISGPGSTGPIDGMTVTPAGSLTSRTISALLGRVVYITDYMALGSTDITAALPLATAKLGSTGGRIVFPDSAAGYTQTAKMTFTPAMSNIVLEGGGRNAAVVTTNFDGDIWAFGDGVGTNQNSGVRNVTFRSSITRTNGAAVALRGTYNFKGSDIFCDVKPYVCVDLYGGPNSFANRLERIHGDDHPYVGIRLGFGSSGDSFPQTTIIRDPLIAGATRAAIEFVSAGGVQLSGGDYILNNVAWLVSPGNNQKVKGLQTFGGYLDTSVNEGLLIVPTGTGTVSDSTFTGFDAATGGQTTGASAVSLQGTSASIRGITFNAPRVFNNGGKGFDIAGGAYINLVAPDVTFNSLFSPNTYSGIFVSGAVSNLTITGGRSGAGSGFNQATVQKYGVEIGNGPAGEISIIGTDLSGNQTGRMLNGATGGCQTIIANGVPAILGCTGNLGVGTIAPNAKLTVSERSRPYTDAASGGATAQVSTGTGTASDNSLLSGVTDGLEAWLQATRPGSSALGLRLNGLGGYVALGKPAATSTVDMPQVPLTNGQPTAKSQPVNGMTPMYVDGQAGKVCFIIGTGTSCATLTAQ